MTDTLPLVLLLLAAAVAVVALFRTLGLPPIMGYLLVGTVMGPHALGWVPDTSQTRHLAEFGVVFLMFSIGLEFSLARLYRMKRIVFGLGAAQVVVSTLVAMLLARLLGVPWLAGIALGGALAMSSTAILSKLLADRGELDAPHGREVIGVLLFQDIAVVPLLVLIPALMQPVEAMAQALLLAGLKAALLLGLVLFVGQRVLSAWFYRVARTKSSELFMLNVLLITLGMAWLTEQAGLSLALGAFTAGMLIGETDYRIQVAEDIKPFRDVLLGLFFVSIGMRLDLTQLASEWPKVIGLLVALLGLKLAIVGGFSRWLGSLPGTALRSGLWLCAGGEFGFVVLARSGEVGLLTPLQWQPVLAALVLSLLLGPLVVQFSDRLVFRFVASEWLMRSMQLTQIAAQSLTTDKHAILCGFGRTGQHLARFLEVEGISFMALDPDPERVRAATAAGEAVSWGDGTRKEMLLAAGLARASVVIITFADVAAALRVIHRVRELRPEVPIVSRARNEEDMEKLYAAGAAEVVPEALESSVMLATHALALSGIPMHKVIKRLREMREQHYALLRGFFHGATDVSDQLTDADQPRLHAVTLTPGAWIIGHCVADLDLEKVGVGITAIRRRSQRGLKPQPSLELIEGDVVVLLGTAAAVVAGEDALLRGKLK
ncbi:potassium transporter [Rugosibacter aromaticivorans]|uniref:Potassium transporter n=2 Tax=Rugosibacter aromaticivorans TaxID=1565605 RepID=A0A0C5J8U1_9PROT|nr:potassium transporter [Rugosibacter aromaticivorans]